LKRRATLRMSLRDKGTWRQPFQPSKQPDSLASLQGHFAATLSRQEDVGKDYRLGRSNIRRTGRLGLPRLASLACVAAPEDGRTPFGSGCDSVRNVQTDRQDACRYAKHIQAPALLHTLARWPPCPEEPPGCGDAPPVRRYT